MGRIDTLPCPKCDYQASSLFDLATHGVHYHREEEEANVPFQELAEYQGFQLEKLPRLGATPPIAHPALAIPEADPTFWVDKPVGRFLYAVGERSSRGEIVNILLVGPTGTGKSSLPKEFAATMHRPFFTMHCQMVTEPGEWWGTKEISPERGTYFQKAALLDAVETPGCIILLDEANRTQAENLNVLFGFMDHRRKAWIPSLNREVVVAPGCIFFVTLNEGADYTGTNAVDRALRDRISNTIRMDYLPRKVEVGLLAKRIGIEEETAWKLVGFAHTIRHNPKVGVGISTRQLLECAALVKGGLPLQDAVQFAIVNSAVEDMERKALLQSLQLTGRVDEAYAKWQSDDEE